jgi:RHS repeat-associated protein
MHMNTLKRLWVCALTLASFSLAGLLGNVDAQAADIITYYHNDISGTPLLATDAAGNVVWKENYQPYGDKLNKQPASAGNKVGFAGKPYDGNTGLSYMGARYYDPVIGRFMGIDPKGFDEGNLHSFNRYTYANNNPYKFVDPDGRAAAAIVALLGVGLVVHEIATGDVPIIGGGVAKAGVTAAERLVLNRAKGEAFEQAVATAEKLRGAEVVEQITVKTQSGTRTRLDLVTKEADGGCKLIECKSSATAGLTKNQTKAFPEIEATGGTVVGKGKGDFPGGTRLQPQKVEIFRPD